MSSSPVPADSAAGVSQQPLSPPAAPDDGGLVLPTDPGPGAASARPAPGPGAPAHRRPRAFPPRDSTPEQAGPAAGRVRRAAEGTRPARPRAARRRVDGFAVAALVTGILALVPLAAGFGAAGLARTRRGRRGGRAAAVGGLVLAGAWTAAGAAVAVVLLGFTPGSSVHPRLLRGTVFRLHSGQCANTARNGVDAARAVPCSQPHQVEVYATFRLAGTAWPGTAALGQRSSLGCLDRMGSYLNPGLLGTSLTGSYVYPDQGAWMAGERTVVCEVRGTSGPLTGSVRGLGRTGG